MKRILFTHCLLVASLVSLSLPGCGAKTDLNAISGTVTLGEEPLQCGTIMFVSMETNGSEAAAPPTTIGVVKGKYEISKKWGLKPGKYRVTIKGFEGTPRGDLLLGNPICPDFNMVFDYTGQKTFDFQMPALRRPMRTVSERELDAISSKQD